jgi:hypothetical protein
MDQGLYVSPTPSNTTSCCFCDHRKVCALYDALFDAGVKIEDYGVTENGLDDKLFETLAGNCNQFSE